MIYVASPYTHKYKDVVENRIQETKKFVNWLIRSGYHPLSIPIHYHDMATEFSLPKTAEFWNEFCQPFLLRSNAVFVLMIDGWKESVGVTYEIETAQKFKISTFYYQPNGENYRTWTF